MRSFLATFTRPRWQYAIVIGAPALFIDCSGGYESCEATRSCPSLSTDAGIDGALGAAGTLPDGSAGTAGSAGTLGAGGTAGIAGTAGTAGTTADGSADSGIDAPDVQPDTTAPTIVSVTPMDGAKGIAKDANVTIVFSEQMDPTKTQAAYSSTDLPPASVDFRWSTDGTTLTIDPKSDLTYAMDAVPSTVQAKRYAFSMATTAADVAGNTLATQFASGFSTLRRVTYKLNSRNQVISKSLTGTTVGLCDTSMLVGAYAGTWVAGLVEFDLSVLPPDLRSFEKAQLDAIQYTGAGEPFGTNKLGEVVCDHTNFNPSNTATLDAAPLRRMGTLSAAPGDATRTLEVVVAVAEDYEQRLSRAYRAQFRIAFTIQNPDLRESLTWAPFDCAPEKLTLALTYLVP